ncbi:MAG: hypothetical protein JWN73_1662 [Betaproteobacteria bacterium]|nr:hypothetical protein [Betaproteobacteria bacterium]
MTATPPTAPPAFILGTWYLDEAYAIDEAGTRLFDLYGAKPDGLIVYGGDGRMVALITHEGRARIDGDRQAAPADQRATAYESSIGYAGPYTVDGERVVHHVDVSTYPNWVGTDLKRFYTREGQGEDESLTLRTPPQMQNGKVTVMKLIWRRKRTRAAGVPS